MSKPATYFTHVNRGKIDSNRKHGRTEPTMRYQRGRYGKSVYGREIELPAGSRLVELEEPLPCGARVDITSPTEPRVLR